MKPEQAAEVANRWRADKADPQKEKEQARVMARSAEAEKVHRRFGAYLDGDYARYQANKKTGKQTLSLIRNRFKSWLDLDMAELSARHVRQWEAEQREAGKAYATIEKGYSALKTMLNQATKEDPPILSDSPLAKVQLQKPLTSNRERELEQARESSRRLLTDDELTGLHTGLAAFAEEIRRQRRNSRKHGRDYLPDLDAVAYPHWFVPFCYVGLYTGFRPGDIFTLTWHEANVTFKQIRKTPEKTRHHRDPAKVIMDMVPPLAAILKGWHKQQGKPQSGLVFPSPVNGGQMDRKAHMKPWRAVKELGGLPADLDFYCLRHHLISRLVANGEPLLNIAKLVGHKSARMIEQHYSHLCPTSAAAALNAFALSVDSRKTA